MRIELGEVASEPPRLVLASAGMLWRDKARSDAVLRAIARARDHYVLVRGDVPLWWHLPVKPVGEVMPSKLTARAENQYWLPPLPQRGLLRRAEGRIERIRAVALKCNPENLPPEVTASSFREELRHVDAELWIDMPRVSSGSDQCWHDFEGVDAVLCARPGPPSRQFRKPATKLINSWVAGCIPLAAREPAYVELADDRDDVWFLDSIHELPSAIRHLNETSGLLDRLQEGVERRRREFAPSRVVAMWAGLLESLATTAPEPSPEPYSRSGLSRARITAWRWRAFHHGARVRNRTRLLRDLAVAGRRSLK
jgi:hypothetical protein